MRQGGGSADVADDRTEATFVPELCRAPALSLLILVSELLACVLVLAGGELSWARLGVVSLFVQWVALCSAGVLCASRRLLTRLGPGRGAVMGWLLVVGVVLGFALLGELVLDPRPQTGARGVAAARVTAVGAILAGLVLRYLYVQQRLRVREQSELRLRLQALQSRIRPHFLFNSMNSIASLIETDPQTAESVVEDLAELFRASLNEAGNQVSLQAELELCERYVRIEQLRLGERLQVVWESDPVPLGVQIPLLTIQPLLENAIYHGVQPLPEGGAIRITVRIAADTVTVTVSNPLPPPALAASMDAQGNRMAIANSRSRLAVLYGEHASLETRRERRQFVSELRYPV